MRINRNKRLKLSIYSVLIIILATSCTSIYNVQVQIAEPAKGELAEDIQSLLLVNRAVDKRFIDYQKDSLQKAFYKKKFKVDTTLFDLRTADTLLQALGELLYESGRYDIVIPEDRFLEHKSSTYFSEEMGWDQVIQLCSDFNTDVVVSLDYFNTNIITDYDTETMYDGVDQRYFKAYYARMAIVYNALFRIYDPLKQQVVKRTFLQDTLIWEDADLSTRPLFNRFTPVKQALVESGIAVAIDFSEEIAPNWKSGSRKYFSNSNPKMAQAHAYASKNEWQKAMVLWKEVAESSSSKSAKSMAEFNVALAYELDGQMDEALRWGLKSYETQYRNITYYYLNTLKKRKAAISKQQMKK